MIGILSKIIRISPTSTQSIKEIARQSSNSRKVSYFTINPLNFQKKTYSELASARAKKPSRTMSSNKTGLPLQQVVDALQSFANTSLASSWDNVGLLIEPTDPKVVSHILLTNDLTEDVMEEAVELRVDMIVSYHPPIFAPLKAITTRTWKERIAARCLENRIALYSPHTSFDSIRGGVNDWLAAAFDLEESRPIEPSDNPNNGMGRFCVLKNKITIDDAVALVKKQTKLQHVRLARGRGSNGSVREVALCAGSGASLLKGLSADLFVTGEMLHHDILDAVHAGTSVILTNHSDSERGFLKTVFQQKLTGLLKDLVTVSVSQKDEDPLKTV